MESAKLDQLKLFINQCKSNPSLLSDPSLSFFRDYLESLGANLPASAYKSGEKHYESKSGMMDDLDDEDTEEEEETTKPKEEEYQSDEVVESDIELEGDVVEPDNDSPQKMGDSSVEVTDENREASQSAKGQAMEAISEGKLEEAVEHLTEAIMLNPTSAIMYATRGYKSRGMAKAMLGQWEEAAKDLHVASKIDYDEEIHAVLKKVEPNAHKIEEHRRKYDRLRKEKEERKVERERQRRKAEAQAAYEKAKKREQSSSSGFPGGIPGGFPGGMPGGFPGMPGGFPGGMPGGFPGGMPGGFGGGMPAGMAGSGMPGMGGGSAPGGMPGMAGSGIPGMGAGGMPGMGAGGMPDMSKILNDPELMAAFKDPEVMAALQDVMKNPANIAKHQSNPRVAPIIAKMMSKFAGPQ
ncbi:hypothetical protein C5167_048807 [Papaver somniferum]|uniref:STI1 domain-containing protein n=1 Tax=Papaver somniferum TaxID=3469 RepID=A0A4Y7KKE2_PAPSO|nr:hypothetical protein C5167_048807 [Papaver somniferum]